MPGGDASWDVLAGKLISEQAELIRRVSEVIKAKLSAYRMIPREALDAEVGLELGQVLRSVGPARAALTDRERAEARCSG